MVKVKEDRISMDGADAIFRTLGKTYKCQTCFKEKFRELEERRFGEKQDEDEDESTGTDEMLAEQRDREELEKAIEDEFSWDFAMELVEHNLDIHHVSPMDSMGRVDPNQGSMLAFIEKG